MLFSFYTASPDDLKQVINKWGSAYNRCNPTTWPEQAKLAAEGNWEDFDKLQAELKSGRS